MELVDFNLNNPEARDGDDALDFPVTKIQIQPLPLNPMLPQVCMDDMMQRYGTLALLLYTMNPKVLPLALAAIVSSFCAAWTFPFM